VRAWASTARAWRSISRSSGGPQPTRARPRSSRLFAAREARQRRAAAPLGERGYLTAACERWRGPIHFLFCNAGINGAIAPIADYPDDVFDQVMAVNVRGSFLALKQGLPLLADGGCVLINASVVAVTADPGICAYATSKHALVGLMRVAAKEAACRGIRVNVVAPGPIDNGFQHDIERRIGTMIGRDATELLNSMIALGRHARPEEIAQTVLFLASSRSSFATGGVFMADGGMSI